MIGKLLNNLYLGYLLDFIGIFLIVYIVYVVFINRRRKELEKLKKSNEVVIFIRRYNLNMKKVTYKKLLNELALINSFIIAFNSLIIIYVEHFVWAALFTFVSIVIMIYAVYEILGRTYIKKGYGFKDKKDKGVEDEE